MLKFDMSSPRDENAVKGLKCAVLALSGGMKPLFWRGAGMLEWIAEKE